MIDKVLFDNDMVHSHDHDEARDYNVNNSNRHSDCQLIDPEACNKLARASLSLRKSLAGIESKDVDPQAAMNIRASQIKLENAVKKELS